RRDCTPLRERCRSCLFTQHKLRWLQPPIQHGALSHGDPGTDRTAQSRRRSSEPQRSPSRTLRSEQASETLEDIGAAQSISELQRDAPTPFEVLPRRGVVPLLHLDLPELAECGHHAAQVARRLGSCNRIGAYRGKRSQALLIQFFRADTVTL